MTIEIIKIIAFLVGGVLVLGKGADLFVQSASHIARRLNIPPIVIGLTVVAFGTSAPEIAVNIIAALNGNPDIAMGNVIGSNIFNIAVILGVSSLIAPLFVSMQLLRIDIPLMAVSALLIWWFGRDGMLTAPEGLILALCLAGYLLLQVKIALKEKKKIQDEFETEFSSKGNLLKDIAILAAGLAMLIVGGNYFVEGAVLGARMLGWSEAIIALTIVAAGTSLPEVATSVTATLKGERDIAIGNVVGSNIFNILGVLGVSSLITEIKVNPHMISVDIPLMVGISLITLPLCVWRKKIERWVGVGYILIWVTYTAYLILSLSGGQAPV